MLYLTLWNKHFDEYGPRGFIDQWRLPSDFNFSTGLPGGFQSGSFTLMSRYAATQAAQFVNVLDNHVIVFDGYTGEVVYEGYVSKADRTKYGDGITIGTEGYYTEGAKKIHGLVYSSSPLYASDIIADTVALASHGSYSYFWAQGDAGITPTTTLDLGRSFDFTGDVKLNDVIQKMSAVGYTATDLRSMHFAIWDGRGAWFFPTTQLTKADLAWLIPRNSLASTVRVSTSSAEQVNKLYALYDDPNGGPTLTSVLEDAISQGMYEVVKEGVLNIGKNSSAIASILQQMYLRDHAHPLFTTSVDVTGRVTSYNGGVELPPYMIRAGDYVRVVNDDYDTASTFGQYDSSEMTSSMLRSDTDGMIIKTTYNGDGRLTLEFGTRTQVHDIIVERLGLVSGGT